MPVKNNRYTLTIDALGVNGEGIGRLDGFTMFVEGALPTETVEILAVKVKKAYGYGKLLRVLTPSAERITPVCPVYGRCGGCSLQHVAYAAQLRYKTDRVRDALKRIGGLDCAVSPTAGMAEPLRYRNKAQLPVGPGRDGAVDIGFYAGRSHRIIPISDCALQGEVNTRIIETVKRYMLRHGIKPYDEDSHTGLIRHVLTRTGFATGEIMVCVVANGHNLPHAAGLIGELRQIPGMTSIVLNSNTARTNVILGAKTEKLWREGREYITDYIGDIRFRISAPSFFQVNPVQTELLYRRAAELARLSPSDTLLDVYCGIGSIALFNAKSVSRVVGIEIVPEAIADARTNAEMNDITNAEFICGAAETELFALIKRVRPDVVFLDPPRKGCDPRCISAIAESGVGRVIYISCDPATLARDLKPLAAAGYAVSCVEPVDFFPMTAHVETVVLLER